MTAPDTITAFDDDGIECEYLFVDSFELDGKTYVVLGECTDQPDDSLSAFLMRLDLVDGDEVFCPLDDDEREAAEAEWARICEQDDEEATLV